MKVLYLHQYFNTPAMSGGTRSYEMARRLVAAGHQVEMITSIRRDSGSENWFSTDEDGVKVHWLPVPYSNEMTYIERMKAFLRFAMAAAGKAASIKADVVFATSTPLTIALPGVYASRRQKIPMVFEVRDLWPELPIAMGALKNPLLRLLAYRLEKFAYRNSSQIVALSPGMADGIVKAGYPAEAVHVIPNSADLDLFRPSDQKTASFRTQHPELGNSPIILYAGTLGNINGVSYVPLMAKAAMDAGSDAKFVVIGDGAESQKVFEVASNAGVLEKNFFMYGRMPKKDVVSAFSAASVVLSLFLDIKEMQANSANKFFDGLASQRPVAINYGGWQKHLLGESEAGLYLTPDPTVGARKILDLLNDSNAIEEMGNAAGHLAEEQFNRDVLAVHLESVLLKAVADRSEA